MIIYDLECLNGHSFEGWFTDRADFETQREKALLACPVCDNTDVVQKLSPICVKTTASPSSGSSMDRYEILEKIVRQVSEYVEKNFEDVGTSFPEQALKMHYGAIEYRNIRGTATREDEKILADEGVPVVRVPVVKKPGDELN